MARGEGSLIKDFVLPEGEWTDDHAQVLEDFLQDVAERHITVKTGSYLGTGRVQTVNVKELPGPPKVLVIQPSAGGTPFITMVSSPPLNITAWDNTGFTLSAGAAMNAANVNYMFFILG